MLAVTQEVRGATAADLAMRPAKFGVTWSDRRWRPWIRLLMLFGSESLNRDGTLIGHATTAKRQTRCQASTGQIIFNHPIETTVRPARVRVAATKWAGGSVDLSLVRKRRCNTQERPSRYPISLAFDEGGRSLGIGRIEGLQREFRKRNFEGRAEHSDRTKERQYAGMSAQLQRHRNIVSGC